MQRKLIFLNVFLMRLPLAAIVSILHRISGILLFLIIPAVLYCFQQSLLSQETFDLIKHYFSVSLVKVVSFVIIGLFLYHVTAGIRHILMDCGIGESKISGQVGAKIVLISFALMFLITGVYLW